MYDFAHDADPQAAGYGAPPLLLTAGEAVRFPVELTSSLVTDLASTARNGQGTWHERLFFPAPGCHASVVLDAARWQPVFEAALEDVWTRARADVATSTHPLRDVSAG